MLRSNPKLKLPLKQLALVIPIFLLLTGGISKRAFLIRNRECVSCDLRSIDLHGKNLTGFNFAYSNLSKANLSHTNLTKAILSNPPSMFKNTPEVTVLD